MTLSCSHMVLNTLIHLSWIICWLEDNQMEPINQQTQVVVRQWEMHELFRYIFLSLPRNFISLCFNKCCFFLNTEWLKYNIAYLPWVSSANRNFKSNRPSAKAASASQDISIDKASQTIDGNTAAADNDRRSCPVRCSASCCGRQRLTQQLQSQQQTPPCFLHLDLLRRQPRPPRPWPRPQPPPKQQHPAGGNEGRGGRGWARAPEITNLFMLDLVYHATATNAPLSGGAAGCKMRSFPAAQPAQPGLGCIRIPRTSRDYKSHTDISRGILTYTDIGETISLDILTFPQIYWEIPT